MSDVILFESYKGYKPENFNEVLFILREPNSDGKEVSADKAYDWIKDVLTHDDMLDSAKDSKAKRAVTRYRNIFNDILVQVFDGEKDRYGVAFDNIFPCCGKGRLSEQYKDYKNKKERAEYIIDNIKPTYVFLCSDVYEIIKAETDIETAGVEYNNKTLNCFCRDGITYYSIYHPCARVSIKNIK